MLTGKGTACCRQFIHMTGNTKPEGQPYRGKGAEMAYKILIIDDDTELLKMLKKFLEIKKYEIITAENRIAERTQILRAPLSVLKGYQEMLTEYLPGEDIDMGQAMEMLSESGRQIEHMDAFVEAMRKLKSLENRQLTPGNIFARQLEKDIQGELAILKKECGKQ